MSTGIVTKPEVLAAIDALQLRYIGALDDKDMSGWLATFSTQADAAYFLTTAQNVDENLPLGLIHDDNHARLEDRVTFVTKIWAGTYQDYQTRHFVQRTACRDLGNGLHEVESNFMILYTPADTGRAEVFADGVYLDCIQVEGDSAVFVSKKAITDTPVVQRYVVFPL